MASFEEAISLGAPFLECDVRLSADGVAMVIHDPTLDRTTDGTGPVHARTAADLRRLNAGTPSAPQRIPFLTEILDPKTFRPVGPGEVGEVVVFHGDVNVAGVVLGDVVLDRAAREVTVAGASVDLRSKEFDLLAYLMENRGLVMGAFRTAGDIGFFVGQIGRAHV